MSPVGRGALTITTVAVCVFLPIIALWAIFANVARDGSVTDFEQVFYPAAAALVDGENPYPSLEDLPIGIDPEYVAEYVYPPVIAIAAIPLTVLSRENAAYLAMALLAGAALSTLLVLGVRDWRCFGVVLIWPPVLSAIQTGNITLLLGLGAAFAWRFRDRAGIVGLSLGLSLAAKLILWPLLLWLAATRRLVAVALSLAVGLTTVAVSWAAIGFDGLREYPDLLRRLQEIEEPEGYTVYALALDLGAAAGVARVLGLVLAVGLLAAVVVAGRRGDDRRAFVLAVAAALAATPIVWLHYFALLLVAVAVAQPRLGAVWFAPLFMYASTGTGNGTTLQTAVTIGAAALTIGLALRAAGTPAPRGALVPAAPLAERPG